MDKQGEKRKFADDDNKMNSNKHRTSMFGSIDQTKEYRLYWLDENETILSHVHKVISRFEYFRQIFESKGVLVKPKTVLSAESNFESNGGLRFLIKNHLGSEKSEKLLFSTQN